MRSFRSVCALMSLVGLIVVLCSSTASARWFSKGDSVVVIEETSVMQGTRSLAVLSRGANFRVTGVSGSYVGISQRIEGDDVNGWVKQADVLKLDVNTTAFYVTRDNLISSQGQRLWLPKDMPLSIQIESDYAVDIFVVNEENRGKYSTILKNGGKGTMNPLASKLNVQIGTLDWNPSSNRQNFLIIDNTNFPRGGAKSGRTIHYSLAYCVDNPTLEGPRNGKGIIIGRATLDYDNYEGKNGRHQKPFKVVVDVFEKEEDDGEAPKAPGGGNVVKTLEAAVDTDGYFFLENLNMSCIYRIKKLDGSAFNAPIPMTLEFGFGFLDLDEDEEEKKKIYRKTVSIGGASISTPCAEPSVLDVGHIALRVNKEGKLQARVDAAHASLATEGGSISFGFGEKSGPLDRHDWFLDKFSGNRWCDVIKLDRDQVYENREEAAKKKAEEATKKKQQKEEKKEKDGEQDESIA